MRLLITSIVLTVVLCIPSAIWGNAAIVWIRGWGAWGWLALSVLVPPVLWLAVRPLLRRKNGGES